MITTSITTDFLGNVHELRLILHVELCLILQVVFNKAIINWVPDNNKTNTFLFGNKKGPIKWIYERKLKLYLIMLFLLNYLKLVNYI